MKTMFVISFEEFNDDDGNDLKLPIAVCGDEQTAWRYADVMPFECDVTEVVVIEEDAKVMAIQ